MTELELTALTAKFYNIRYPRSNFYSLKNEVQRDWKYAMQQFISEIDVVLNNKSFLDDLARVYGG